MPSLSQLAYKGEDIKCELQKNGFNCLQKIEYFPSIDSSNTYLLQQDSVHGRVCVADYQTRGKGRRGKEWHSQPGESLMFSLGWRPKTLQYGELSLVIGLALASVLQRLGVDVTLKWPNDVMVGHAKLAGILVESKIRDAEVQLVIGVGLNYHFGQGSNDAIQRPCIDMYQLGLSQFGRLRLLVLVLTEIKLRLSEFERAGFGGLRTEWLNYYADMGQDVRFERQDKTLEGKIIGLDAQGALLIQQGDNTLVVNSGEVHTLRCHA